MVDVVEKSATKLGKINQLFPKRKTHLILWIEKIQKKLNNFLILKYIILNLKNQKNDRQENIFKIDGRVNCWFIP
jgi:hypothetical protein